MSRQTKIFFLSASLFGLLAALLLKLFGDDQAALGAVGGTVLIQFVVLVLHICFFGTFNKGLRFLLALLKLPVVVGGCYLASVQGVSFCLGFLVGFGSFIPAAFSSTSFGVK